MLISFLSCAWSDSQLIVSRKGGKGNIKTWRMKIKVTLSNLQKEKKRNKDGQWNTSDESNPACKQRGAHLKRGIFRYANLCVMLPCGCRCVPGDPCWPRQPLMGAKSCCLQCFLPHCLVSLFFFFNFCLGKKYPSTKLILACFLIFRSFKGGHGAGSLEQYTCMYQCVVCWKLNPF